MHNEQNDTEVSLEELITRIQQRIENEPNFRVVLYKMLKLCHQPKTISQIETAVLDYPEMNVPLQTPHVLLSWLIQCQAIEAIDLDESETQCKTTLAGIKALEIEQNSDKLESLFQKEEKYKSVYLDIISLCKEPKTRMEIEKFLANNLLLENPKIYPSYFIDTLELAGGLEWNNQWIATQNALSKVVNKGVL